VRADATESIAGGAKGGCWLLESAGGTKVTQGRVLGFVGAQRARPAVGPGFPQQRGPQFSDVKLDLYLFAHGWKFTQALSEYTQIGGKAIMVPKYAMGIWWSRWYDLNNFDTQKVVDDYESRSIPLDVFVIDMDWHTKDNWSGFTFDPHLFPDPADSMGFLRAKGLHVTLNLHDASGVPQTARLSVYQINH
jgi:alpha-glucosidase (family GH31 glycosyl hydrolase)